MNSVDADVLGVPLSPDGRLACLEDWNEQIAAELAAMDGLMLTEEHWEVIHLMRDFYREYNISPIRKLLKKTIADQYGNEKASDTHLDRLFPDDVEIQGTRIAGLDIPLTDKELDPHRYAGSMSNDNHQVTRLFDEFEFEGERIHVYPNGNLVDRDQWSEGLAEYMAQKEGLGLTPEHWEVIRFLRAFYFNYGVTPMVKLLMNHMAMEQGPEKSTRDYLYSLFPGGPSRQGSRIAGLPEPQGCIDP